LLLLPNARGGGEIAWGLEHQQCRDLHLVIRLGGWSRVSPIAPGRKLATTCEAPAGLANPIAATCPPAAGCRRAALGHAQWAEGAEPRGDKLILGRGRRGWSSRLARAPARA
jgi:hypothetical protein